MEAPLQPRGPPAPVAVPPAVARLAPPRPVEQSVGAPLPVPGRLSGGGREPPLAPRVSLYVSRRAFSWTSSASSPGAPSETCPGPMPSWKLSYPLPSGDKRGISRPGRSPRRTWSKSHSHNPGTYRLFPVPDASHIPLHSLPRKIPNPDNNSSGFADKSLRFSHPRRPTPVRTGEPGLF